MIFLIRMSAGVKFNVQTVTPNTKPLESYYRNPNHAQDFIERRFERLFGLLRGGILRNMSRKK